MTHLKDLETRDVEDTDEGRALPFGSVKWSIDSRHQPLEEALVDRLADRLHGEFHLQTQQHRVFVSRLIPGDLLWKVCWLVCYKSTGYTTQKPSAVGGLHLASLAKRAGVWHWRGWVARFFSNWKACCSSKIGGGGGGMGSQRWQWQRQSENNLCPSGLVFQDKDAIMLSANLLLWTAW